jgi:Ca2+-binding EF-hand superfamily protein
MLRRFDRNGNNMIDMDEREGPARFFIERMAQNNSRIDINRPIPLDRLAGEMERMRQERGGGPPGSPGAPSPASNAPAVPEPLVPGFDKIEEPPPVQGFGLPDPNASIKVEDRDLREAEDRLKRYDSNKDGVLSKDELAGGRWSDDPMQYDRNGDGKINKNELAVRYAKRRLGDQANPSQSSGRSSSGSSSRAPSSSSDPRSRYYGSSSFGSSSGSPWGSRDSRGGDSRGFDRGGDSRGFDRGGDNGGGWGSRDGGDRAASDEKKEEPKSYRAMSAKDKANAVKGLPDWFARSDADADGQVMMSEYSTTWTNEKVAEFNKFDLNGDGIITSRECLNSLKNGSSTTAGSTTIASSSIPSTSSSSSASIVAPVGAAKEDVNRDWAKRQIEKYDKNRDGQLTVDEWSAMIVKPEGADANKDGIVTLEEYVTFRAAASK